MSENTNLCPGCGSDRIGESVYQKAGMHATGCPWYTVWSSVWISSDGNTYLLNENAWKSADMYWRERWKLKVGDWVVVHPDKVKVRSNPWQIDRFSEDGNGTLICHGIAGYRLWQLRPAYAHEIERVPMPKSTEPARCVGCGKAESLREPHPKGCPWAAAYDDKLGDHQEREVYADGQWRAYWAPKEGDWVRVSDNPTQPARQIQKSALLLTDSSLKKEFRPAWPDEIAAATRGSIPIKVEAGTRGKDSSQRLGSSEDAGASAADAAPPLTPARPALVLRVGMSYRARGGWKAVSIGINSLGNFSVKHDRPSDESVHGHSIKTMGHLWHRPDGIVDSASKSPPPSDYDLIEKWPDAVGEASVLVGHVGEPAVQRVEADQSQTRDRQHKHPVGMTPGLFATFCRCQTPDELRAAAQLWETQLRVARNLKKLQALEDLEKK